MESNLAGKRRRGGPPKGEALRLIGVLPVLVLVFFLQGCFLQDHYPPAAPDAGCECATTIDAGVCVCEDAGVDAGVDAGPRCSYGESQILEVYLYEQSACAGMGPSCYSSALDGYCWRMRECGYVVTAARLCTP